MLARVLIPFHIVFLFQTVLSQLSFLFHLGHVFLISKFSVLSVNRLSDLTLAPLYKYGDALKHSKVLGPHI